MLQGGVSAWATRRCLRTCRKVLLAVGFLWALFPSVSFVLCAGRQHEVYDGLRGTHDPCVRTPRKQVAVQRPTLVSAVFSDPPAPMGKLIPTSCVSQLACFQKTVQPSHRNHACSSAPGGLRPIGLPSTSENLSVTPGSSHPNPRACSLSQTLFPSIWFGLFAISQKVSVICLQLFQHFIWRVSLSFPNHALYWLCTSLCVWNVHVASTHYYLPLYRCVCVAGFLFTLLKSHVVSWRSWFLLFHLVVITVKTGPRPRGSQHRSWTAGPMKRSWISITTWMTFGMTGQIQRSIKLFCTCVKEGFQWLISGHFHYTEEETLFLNVNKISHSLCGRLTVFRSGMCLERGQNVPSVIFLMQSL